MLIPKDRISKVKGIANIMVWIYDQVASLAGYETPSPPKVMVTCVL